MRQQIVAPKRAALAEANRKLEGATRKLAGIRGRVAELQERVAALEAQLMAATEDKNAAIATAERTAAKAALAGPADRAGCRGSLGAGRPPSPAWPRQRVSELVRGASQPQRGVIPSMCIDLLSFLRCSA